MSTGGNEGAAVIGAYENKKAAKEERKATEEATARQIAEQKRQYDQNRADLRPFTEAGYSATASMQDLLGYNGPEAQQKAIGAFRSDPGYQYAMDQGVKAIDRSASARGGLYSGRTALALQAHGQGMADQQYGSYYSRLFNNANMGRGTATGVAQMGTDYANTMSGLYGQLGQAKANYYNRDAQGRINLANTIGQGVQYTGDKVVDTAGSLYGAYAGGK